MYKNINKIYYGNNVSKFTADVIATHCTSWHVVNEEILQAFDKSPDNCAPPGA